MAASHRISKISSSKGINLFTLAFRSMISFSRLGHIITDGTIPTDQEKRNIAKNLNMEVDELFNQEYEFEAEMCRKRAREHKRR